MEFLHHKVQCKPIAEYCNPQPGEVVIVETEASLSFHLIIGISDTKYEWTKDANGDTDAVCVKSTRARYERMSVSPGIKLSLLFVAGYKLENYYYNLCKWTEIDASDAIANAWDCLESYKANRELSAQSHWDDADRALFYQKMRQRKDRFESMAVEAHRQYWITNSFEVSEIIESFWGDIVTGDVISYTKLREMTK